MEDLKDKIYRLEQEITKLPTGYISKKIICGKKKQYYQWTEDKKKKSKYVDDKEAGLLSLKIDKRRRLQQDLKILKNQVKLDKNYYCEILTGDALKIYVDEVRDLKCRFLINDIHDYLNTKTDSRVLILYGLRRTGKTTLIRQTILGFNSEKFDKAAFMHIRLGDTMAFVNKDLKKLQSLGYKYIFIDEVTLMEDFIEGAALFSDIYAACGMKIILSGTDSLGFLFSADEQLYDRCKMIHTTFIPYREFESVLGISGIDEYIKYGGTMSLSGVHYNVDSPFSSVKKTDDYIDSAIANNIQHSLKFYQDAGHFRHLQDLYDKKELTSAINRIVEDINHRFTIDVLTKDFVSHDLGISSRNLRNDRKEPTDVLDNIDKDVFTKRLKEALSILNKNEQSIEIDDACKIEIKEYLDLLDLTIDIPVCFLPVNNKKDNMIVISQPGLRYSQAEALIEQLSYDAYFRSVSAIKRKRIIDRILDEIKGRMMEEIVLLETKKAFPKKEVFKLKFAIDEFDMVVLDKEEVTCNIYEIKHSKLADPWQYRHLVDKKKCADTEFCFGKIAKKIVIYRGEDKKDGEIEYLNVEKYLNSLGCSDKY